MVKTSLLGIVLVFSKKRKKVLGLKIIELVFIIAFERR